MQDLKRDTSSGKNVPDLKDSKNIRHKSVTPLDVNDVLDLAVKLSCLPEVSTNALKATTGLLLATSRYPWLPDEYCFTGDVLKDSCGMAATTVVSSLPELGIMKQTSAGQSWSFDHPGKAARYSLRFQIPRCRVLWPALILNPGHPLWDRGSAGPNAWRLVLMLLENFGFDQATFTAEDICSWSGWDKRTTFRAINAIKDIFISQYSYGHYLFSPGKLEEMNVEPAPRVKSNRDIKKQAKLDLIKTTWETNTVTVANFVPEPLGKIGPQLKGETNEEYAQVVNKLQGLIDRVADRDRARYAKGLVPVR